MAINSTNKPIWQALYELADTFSALKPWEYIREYHVFGVEDPETKVISYCSILGHSKEVFAINVYPGEKGFSSYLDMIDSAERPVAMMQTGIEQNCIMISWENREQIDAVDYEQLKALGKKYRGKNNWPMFRDYSPGLYPWFITDAQAKSLIPILQQAIYVVQNFKENPDEIGFLLDDEKFLIRRANATTKDQEWASTYEKFDFEKEIEPNYIPQEPNSFQIARIKKDYPLEEDFSLILSLIYSNSPVQEMAGQRPFFPLLMVWMGRESGFIHHFQIFENNAWWMEFEMKFLEGIEKLKKLPESMVIGEDRMGNMLYPFTSALGIDLYWDEEEVDEYLAELQGFMGGGGFF